MKYNLYTFTALDQQFFVAELIQLDKNKSHYNKFLSSEEFNILVKRKHKQTEFIFSRYIIKKIAGISNALTQLTTIKYCQSMQAAGIFHQQELIKKLSLSHSGKFVAFSFCPLNENIGIDIETITNRNVQPLINEFFCVQDKQLIFTAADFKTCFYQLWTEKEAVTKLINTSIFTLLAHSSTELNNNHHLKTIIRDDFVVSIAKNKRS